MSDGKYDDEPHAPDVVNESNLTVDGPYVHIYDAGRVDEKIEGG